MDIFKNCHVIKKVMKLLKDAKIDESLVSPNFVADFAYNRGISLSSYDVVYISNSYLN